MKPRERRAEAPGRWGRQSPQPGAPLTSGLNLPHYHWNKHLGRMREGGQKGAEEWARGDGRRTGKEEEGAGL